MPARSSGSSVRGASHTSVRIVGLALFAQFGLFGMIMSSWMSRIPSIREALDVTALQLGSMLIAGGVGSFLGAFIVGGFVARFGSRVILLAGIVGNILGFGLLAASVLLPSQPLFLLGMALNGACGAFINVPININAAAYERQIGRTVLPQFHAAFSIGAAAGAFSASLFSAAGISAGAQVIVMTGAITLLRVLTLRASCQPTAQKARTATPQRTRGAFRSALAAWAEPRTIMLGVVLLAGSLSEGTAGTWLSLAVVDGYAQPEAIGAAVYATFLGAMTVFRITGVRLIDRFGRVWVLRISGAVVLVGVLLFIFGGTLPLAWSGVVLWGMGAALGVPIAIAAASDDPEHAGQRVAVVTSFSTIASLAAPPLLGLLVDQVGVLTSLLVVAAAAVISLSFSSAVRRSELSVVTTQTAPVRIAE